MRDFLDFAVRFPIIKTVPAGIGASRFGRKLLGPTAFKVFDICYNLVVDRGLSRMRRAQGCCLRVCWIGSLSDVRQR